MAWQRTNPFRRFVTRFAFLAISTSPCAAAPPQWIELGGSLPDSPTDVSFGATSGEGGTTYVLERATNPVLRAIAPDGTTQWSRTLRAMQPDWTGAPRLARLRLNNGVPAVCVALVLDDRPDLAILPPPTAYLETVLCYRALDGTPISSAQVSIWDQRDVQIGGIQPLSDGTLVAWGVYFPNLGPTAVPKAFVVDPLASPGATAIPLGPTVDRVLSATSDGQLLVRDDGDAPRYFRVLARNGAVAASFPIGEDEQPVGGTVLPDGDMLALVGRRYGNLSAIAARRFAPDATLRWRQALASLQDPVSLVVRGELVFAAEPAPLGAGPGGKLSRIDPDVAYFRFVESTPESPMVLLAPADASRVVLASARGNGVVVQVMDATTWRLVAGADVPCGARTCAIASAEIGPDGRMLVAVSRSSDGVPLRGRVLRLDVPAPPARGAAAGQLAVEGAWYSRNRPYVGLVLDYVPLNDTLFGLYYEGDRQATANPDALDWYSLQGAGGSSAVPTLATYESESGRFVTRGAFTAESQRRRFEITFEDCDHATLLENGGAQRVVSLQRLTRRNAGACREGGTQPVAGDASPRAIEGSWFNPATRGQGLSIAVDRAPPPAAESLFAGWFTFDTTAGPLGSNERHWFSIQGPVPAIGGRVDATIYQSPGGVDDVTGNNTRVVGTAELALTACDRLELRYRFNDSAEARTFAGLTGTQVLTRIGGCD